MPTHPYLFLKALRTVQQLPRGLLSLAILAAVLFSGMAKPALAQSSKPQLTTAQEQRLFIERLIGPWSIISSDYTLATTPAMLEKALAGCKSPQTFANIKVQAGADTSEPKKTDIRGNLLYYKTEKGLQRLDIEQKEVVLISQIRQREIKPGQTLYQLSSKGGSITLLLTRIGNDNGNMPVLIEEKALYLRCPEFPNPG